MARWCKSEQPLAGRSAFDLSVSEGLGDLKGAGAGPSFRCLFAAGVRLVCMKRAKN